MKKTLKRGLSLFLTIAIIFGSMYVGLSEVDWDGLFVVKAKAAEVYTITLAGGYREINGITRLESTFNDTIASTTDDYFIDENGVYYVIDRTNNTISFQTDYSSKYTVPDNMFEMLGYYQDGWSIKENGNSGTYKVGTSKIATEDTTLYPKYSNSKTGPYLVTLVGGERTVNGKKVYGELLDVIKNQPGDTYTFNGVEYTIHRDDNALTFVTDGKNYTLSSAVNFFKMPGHSIKEAGWSASKTSSSSASSHKINTKLSVSNNTKLLAPDYVQEKYEIKLSPGAFGIGEEEILNSGATYNLQISLVDKAYTRSGYVQIGWATTDGATEAEIEMNGYFRVEGATTLYPVWTPAVYDLVKNVDSINFGSMCEGCIEDVESVDVEILNNSNTQTSFTMPESEYFNVTYSGTELAIGEELSVQISPKDTLTAGEYNERLVLGINDFETTVEIDVSFNVIASSGHMFGDFVVAKEPTCAEDGSKHKECSVCGYITEITAIPAFGHSFDVNSCTVCGESIFTYEVTADGVVITGLVSPCEEIVIPSTIDETPVVAIGDKAFYMCSEITSVKIPEGITHIGEWAFYNCSNLVDLWMPSSIKSIGDSAFGWTGALEKINITDIKAWCEIEFEDFTSNPIVDFDLIINGDLENFNRYMYLNGIPVIDLVLPDEVTSICDYAFWACTSIESVTIPDSVQSIGEQAFYGCWQMQNVTIGKGVSNIGSNAFGCNMELSYINVDEDNTSYTSIDGVLFNEAITEIVQYPVQKPDTKYKIPSSVTSIADGAFGDSINLVEVEMPQTLTSIGVDAFGDCASLKSIIIPDGVTVISSGAFSYCTALESVVLPANLETINDLAFWRCESLESVTFPKTLKCIGYQNFDDYALKYIFFEGSESEWNEIIIDADSFSDKAIHYNSTDHTMEYKIDEVGTCLEDGLRHLECTVCGYSKEPEVIVAEGHKYSTEWTVDVAATCTEAGSKSHHCTGCDDRIDVTVIEAIGHNYMFADITQKPQVSVHPHILTQKCTYCGDTKQFDLVFDDCIHCIYGENMPIQGTENTTIDFTDFIIRTTVQKCGNIEDIIQGVSTVIVTVEASCNYGDTVLYGTDSKVTVYDGELFIGEFTLVVEGDVNGDSIVDALDAMQVGLASNGVSPLYGAYDLAADINADNVIDANDYQAIVNKAIA